MGSCCGFVGWGGGIGLGWGLWLSLGLETRDGTGSGQAILGNWSFVSVVLGVAPAAPGLYPRRIPLGKAQSSPLCPTTPALGVMGTGDMEHRHLG